MRRHHPHQAWLGYLFHELRCWLWCWCWHRCPESPHSGSPVGIHCAVADALSSKLNLVLRLQRSRCPPSRLCDSYIPKRPFNIPVSLSGGCCHFLLITGAMAARPAWMIGLPCGGSGRARDTGTCLLMRRWATQHYGWGSPPRQQPGGRARFASLTGGNGVKYLGLRNKNDP